MLHRASCVNKFDQPYKKRNKTKDIYCNSFSFQFHVCTSSVQCSLLAFCLVLVQKHKKPLQCLSYYESELQLKSKLKV